MHNQDQLVEQIAELQTAVGEMKTSFASAMRWLTESSHAAAGPDTFGPAGVGCPDDDDVIHTIRGLQTELAEVTAAVQQLQQGQQATRRQLRLLLDERDVLLDELCRTDSVSGQTRQQLYRAGLQFPSRTSSGCHSNDSGLGPAPEKVRWSDQDSTSVSDEPFVSTIVQQYVNGLENGGDSYESDSSLTMTIDKSLAFSSCLSKQCDLELDELNETDGQPRSEAGQSELEEAERLGVVRELAETERRYCATLWTVQDTFAEPLAASSLLSEEEFGILFPAEAGQLYEKHCRLLHSLEERLQTWPWLPSVGDLLCRFISGEDSEVLHMYTTYVAGFPELLNTFYRLCPHIEPICRIPQGSPSRRVGAAATGTWLAPYTDGSSSQPATLPRRAETRVEAPPPAQPLDCRSLPHIKQQRRRRHLSAARSETNLQPPARPASLAIPSQPRPARSELDLQAETSSSALQRLDFGKVAPKEPRPRPVTARKVRHWIWNGDSERQPGRCRAVRTMVVSPQGRCVTPEPPPPGDGPPAASTQRKVSLRTIRKHVHPQEEGTAGPVH
ncbi:rho guanine nucleotide exchange factor 33-like [Pollicipes pollicipes]|uniref:rho guanine nucleotide exchange factor 33-like n=1 Tax=Pollicipes pollicipes TaxID=41117 RepID=UPI001884C341|nr:rho guanine nucleotide exchange factor 33-like [Pollicipes pollicipes]